MLQYNQLMTIIPPLLAFNQLPQGHYRPYMASTIYPREKGILLISV